MISPRTLLGHAVVPVGLVVALLLDPSPLGIVGDAVTHRAFAAPLPSAVVVSDVINSPRRPDSPHDHQT